MTATVRAIGIEALEAKAQRLLIDGRVWVRRVVGDLVLADVWGDTGLHDVRHDLDGWSCSCRAWQYRRRCSHVLAVELIATPPADPRPAA